MKTAIFAGSFDPFTNGHLDIAENGAKIFDKVIILVANNSKKKYMLPAETRVNLITKSISHIKNVEVDFYNGLTVEYAQKHNAKFLIRGVRTLVDFEYETQMSQINDVLASDILTILIPATKETNYISSSMIRDILINKGDISSFVPPVVTNYLGSDCVVEK